MNYELRGAHSFDSVFRLAFLPNACDFDELGHVNNARYLRWAQEIAVAHGRAEASENLKSRRLWAALRHEIDYRDPILPGDAFEGRTWLGAADGARFDRYVDIRKPGAVRPAAAVISTWVRVDAQTRKPRPVGAEIEGAFDVCG